MQDDAAQAAVQAAAPRRSQAPSTAAASDRSHSRSQSPVGGVTAGSSLGGEELIDSGIADVMKEAGLSRREAQEQQDLEKCSGYCWWCLNHTPARRATPAHRVPHRVPRLNLRSANSRQRCMQTANKSVILNGLFKLFQTSLVAGACEGFVRMSHFRSPASQLTRAKGRLGD